MKASKFILYDLGYLSNYNFHLYALHRSNKSQHFKKTKASGRSYILCAENDEVYIFYSDFRLEVVFLRSRFFQKDKVRLVQMLDIKRWVNTDNAHYKSNIELRRLALSSSYIVLDINADEDYDAYKLVLNKIAAELNTIKSIEQRNKIAQQDLFLIIDDPVGIANYIADDIRNWHIQQQALLLSLQTALPQTDIYNSMCKKSSFDLDDLTQQAGNDPDVLYRLKEVEAMQTMGLLLKKFFIDQNDLNTSPELKRYISDCKQAIDKQNLDNILAIELRKKVCDEINIRREILLYFLSSPLFHRYTYLFLDKKEINGAIESEDALAFVIPESYKYNFFKEGATYNYMICSLKYIMLDLLSVASLSPYKKDLLLKDKMDPLKFKFINILKPNLQSEEEIPRSFFLKIIVKEMISREYFDSAQQGEVMSFFENKDLSGWELTSFIYTIGTGVSDWYLYKNLISADVTFTLLPNKNGEIDMRDKAKKGLRSSTIISDNKILIRTTDYRGNLKDQQFALNDPKVSFDLKGGINGFAEVEIEGQKKIWIKGNKITVSNIYVSPKTNWESVHSATGVAKYIMGRLSEIIDYWLGNTIGGSIGFILSFQLYLNNLSDTERSLIRKSNDFVIVGTAFMGLTELYVSKEFLESTMNNPFYKLNKIPGLKKIKPSVPKSFLFRSFVILGNIADGIDTVLESLKMIDQGNVIVGNVIRYTGLLQIISPALLAIPNFGWGAYLILTISLFIVKFIVGLVKDSVFELFIETTFFGKKLSYTPRYLKTGSTLQSMQNLHTDIELLLQKDSKLKRKKPHQHIRNFRNQLDELMMMHLFTPTVGEGFVKLYYVDAMSNAGSGKKLIEYYPRSIAISFSADFSLLINQIETIDIRVYLSDEGEPSSKDLRLLSDFQGIEENKIYANARLLDKADKHSFLRGSTADDHLTYEEGKLTYLYTLTDRSFYEKNHPRQLYTYPFFNKGSYYIFVYLRYRLNGKSIMPTRRDNKSSYLVTKFKIEAINHPQQFDYNMILLESKINNLPD